MTGNKPAEQTVILTSPYGSQVTVSMSDKQRYLAAGYRELARRATHTKADTTK